MEQLNPVVKANALRTGALIFLVHLCVSAAHAQGADRCARLFKEPTAIATCGTLSRMSEDKLSDEELRERVARTVYGVGASDVEAIEAVIDEERRHAVAKDGKDRFPAQCLRLFERQEEREACRTLQITSTSVRTDEQMRQDVRKRLDTQRKEKAAAEAERRRKAAAIEAEKQRTAAAAKARDAELAKGTTGFIFDGWELSRIGSSLTISFALQNNTAAPQKDIVIGCSTYANSGTLLTTTRQTLYELLRPKERRRFQLEMGLVHAQSARASCRVVSSSQ